ncbi:hypothetical protein BIV23_32915 [Streptomyces monashensis]|uniref:Uncharacterized protein n=1 Tax=Streptomyces monashensis TaxID=1678012 RepID=A0A1S2PS80_9ACTN|nr:hypothetical protein BIV23_32915 [Streptomyces monashensis]
MPVLEWGEARGVLVLDVVALGTELGDGDIQVAGAPQDDGVEDQAEGGELVLSERAQPTARQGYARVESLKAIV